MAEPNPSPAPTGVSSIYIASAEGDTGKSAIALGVLHLLAAFAARVGVFRPIVRSTDEPDYLLELLPKHATATLDDYGQCLGVTYDEVDEGPAALSEIVEKYHEVARQCDAVVVIDSDYTDVVNPGALTFNARIAVNLGAPVLLAVNGRDRSPETITRIAQHCLTEVAAAHARTAVIIVNRCDPKRLDEVTKALATTGLPAFRVPEVPLLAAPTMAEPCEALGGTLYSGDPELLRHEAMSLRSAA
jgi:phosphate acetyltransferase